MSYSSINPGGPMRIKCSSCGEVVRVYGQVWRFRLRHSDRDPQGNYLGWNCDPCADRIEGGYGY